MAAPRRSEEKEILGAALTGPASADSDNEDTIQPKAKAPAKGKKKLTAAKSKPQIYSPKEAMITYLPRLEGDIAFTMVAGIKFSANVPKKVTNPEVIATLRQNPWFSIDGKPPPPMAKQAKPRDTSEDVKARDDIDPEKEVEVEDVINGTAAFSEDVN